MAKKYGCSTIVFLHGTQRLCFSASATEGSWLQRQRECVRERESHDNNQKKHFYDFGEQAAPATKEKREGGGGGEASVPAPCARRALRPPRPAINPRPHRCSKNAKTAIKARAGAGAPRKMAWGHNRHLRTRPRHPRARPTRPRPRVCCAARTRPQFSGKVSRVHGNGACNLDF